MLVPPSPKFHDQPVMFPVEVSVKETVNGLLPVVGVPLKFATGTDSVTIMYPVFVSVSEPPGPVTVNDTVNVPVDV